VSGQHGRDDASPEGGSPETRRSSKEDARDQRPELRLIDGDERRRSDRADIARTPIKLQPPTFVPMTEQEYREAVSAIAELLLWVWEVKRQQHPAA
jgi:hypothetical protein